MLRAWPLRIRVVGTCETVRVGAADASGKTSLAERYYTIIAISCNYKYIHTIHVLSTSWHDQPTHSWQDHEGERQSPAFSGLYPGYSRPRCFTGKYFPILRLSPFWMLPLHSPQMNQIKLRASSLQLGGRVFMPWYTLNGVMTKSVCSTAQSPQAKSTESPASTRSTRLVVLLTGILIYQILYDSIMFSQVTTSTRDRIHKPAKLTFGSFGRQWSLVPDGFARLNWDRWMGWPV